MTQQEELEAIAAMLTIIAAKTRNIADITHEEQASCVSTLALQITDLAVRISRIAGSDYAKGSVITKLTAI